MEPVLSLASLARSVERSQHGLAATLRLVVCEDIIGGITTEDLSHALRFTTADPERPGNLLPLDRDEFTLVCELVLSYGSVRERISEREHQALLGALYTALSTDASVTASDLRQVEILFRDQFGQVDPEYLEMITRELSDQYGLDLRPHDARFDQDSPAEDAEPGESDQDPFFSAPPASEPESFAAERAPEIQNDDQTAQELLELDRPWTDHEIARCATTAGLARFTFEQIVAKLLAYTASRDIAAHALLGISLLNHAQDVTVELRTKYLAALYKEVESEEIRNLTLEALERASTMGFPSNADLPFEDVEEEFG